MRYLNNKKIIFIAVFVFMFACFTISDSVFAESELTAGCALDMDISTHNYIEEAPVQDIESSTTAWVNSYIFVAIVGQNVTNLDTYQIEVKFNPENLQFIMGVEENPFAGMNNLLKKNNGTTFGFQAIENTSGTINIANTLIGNDSGQAPEGSGILALLQFKILDDSSETSLTLENVHYVDSLGKDQPINNLLHATVK